MAWEARCGRECCENDEEYKEYLEDIRAISWGPCRVFEILAVKGERSTLRYREIMLGTWPLLEEEKQLVYWIRQEGKQGSQVFRMSGRQIKELYYKVSEQLA
nr:ADM_HP1_G0017330.mRNA.1.CDS.1 [Saccharomyces cerevisiae]